jgi:(1->4)-alpha-D-glucan 1-alpha-D-glucosylmutase
MDTGMPKLWLLHCALELRRQQPAWFGVEADYTPLAIEGRRMDFAIGYLRAGRVATIVPRWNVKRGANWLGTTISLPEGHWTNWITSQNLSGGRIQLQSVLERFPVALLVREAG